MKTIQGPYRTELRATLTLALPLIGAQLAQNSMSFVDTLFVGRLGPAELAGIALGSSTFMFVFILLMGVVLAVGPLVAQAHGGGRRGDVARAVRSGLWVGLALGVPATVFFWNVEPILARLGQEPETVRLAGAYLRAIAWGFLPYLWLISLRSFLEGISQVRPVLLIVVAGVAMNVFWNNALMFGRWGFPELGLVGTGYASAIVFWTMFLLAALYVGLSHRDYRIFRDLRVPNLPTIREILVLGTPIGLTLGSEVGLFSGTAFLMGILGATALAAHQIALQTASMTFMIPLGLSIATSVRVGQAVGRRDRGAASRAAAVGMALSLGVMALTALAYWLAPHHIIGLYIDRADPANIAVAALAVTFLGYAAAFQIFDGLQVSAIGSLRGLKDTRIPMVITLFAYWGVGITSGAVLAFPLGLGGRGLWLGLVIGLAVAGVLLVARLLRSFRDVDVAELGGGDTAAPGTVAAPGLPTSSER